jgi:hypothetical protein
MTGNNTCSKTQYIHPKNNMYKIARFFLHMNKIINGFVVIPPFLFSLTKIMVKSVVNRSCFNIQPNIIIMAYMLIVQCHQTIAKVIN